MAYDTTSSSGTSTTRNSNRSSETNSTSDLSDLARENLQNVKEGAHILKNKAQEAIRHIEEDSEKYIKEATDYVKENPTKSVLTALAAGLIIGLLLKN